MKIAILTANLGNFDIPVDPIRQNQDWNQGDDVLFHRFTDENFPPIAGLTPRFQYRIPKLFGWEMVPNYDIYIWLDGSFSFTNPDSLKWFINQLGDADIALFKHPQRKSILEESLHIEQKLKEGSKYITPRYKNGLHKEMVDVAYNDPNFKDNVLFTSTAFIYRNNSRVHKMMGQWWFWQSKFFTCDQVSLPYAIFQASYVSLKVNVIEEDQYKIPYLTLVSPHK